MGIIKALVGSTQGVLEDQWKEFFSCGEFSPDVLARRGYKSVSSRSSNHGDDNIITDGSVVALHNGQAMVIVEGGKVIDSCTEAGSYVVSTASPTVFSGGFTTGLKKSVKEVGRRFTFGGDVARIQRVYFFNTKEITGNRFATQGSIPLRVKDSRGDLDADLAVRISGRYSFKITDPELFYKNVCGNIADEYRCSNLKSQMESEVLTELQRVISGLTETGTRLSDLPNLTFTITLAMKSALTKQWKEVRGITVVSFGVDGFDFSKEDRRFVRTMQRNESYTDPVRAAASLIGAQGDAMKTAAANSAGFGGMAMVAWTCQCGWQNNTGRFCTGCGRAKPDTWTCSCGRVNKGKFCEDCGQKQP